MRPSAFGYVKSAREQLRNSWSLPDVCGRGLQRPLDVKTSQADRVLTLDSTSDLADHLRKANRKRFHGRGGLASEPWAQPI